MEERVDAAPARANGDRAASFEKLDLLHAEVADAQVGSDRAGFLEIVFGMNAGSRHDMERTRERVLMDVGGSVQPEQDLNVETRMRKGHQFGLTEAGHPLKWLLVIDEELADHVA